MNPFEQHLIKTIRLAGKRGISPATLKARMRIKPKDEPRYYETLDHLQASGAVEKKRGRFFLPSRVGLHPAVITRINGTFGFATLEDNDQEVFIPGKYLKGALPQDRVLIAYIPARKEGGLEGEVVRIVQYAEGLFTGVLVSGSQGLAVLPDRLTRHPILVLPGKKTSYRLGEKVLAQVVKRGDYHTDHRCQVLESFGDSQDPVACARALLKGNDIPTEFSPEALREAEKAQAAGIPSKAYRGRTDLRDQLIFTIDSADAKDLDDAVSLTKTADGYRLGVHIADVSHYLPIGSALDREAFARGTSIYYADQVVPMLPPALSNGICSLNEGADRLTFSALLTLSKTGQLLDYRFEKSVIRSRVKGVYAEINQLLDHTADPQIRKKYAEMSDTLFEMDRLAEILRKNRAARGAPEIRTREGKITMSGNQVAEITLRQRGRSEQMIEEFMLLANQAAAAVGRERSLPFVYRVHQPPEPEKMENLLNVLRALGQPVPAFSGEISPGQLAQILKNGADTPYDPLLNLYVLRSMSKAKYAPEPIGHFGLVLQDYAHFTSPIRRYPDLAIHRILSALTAGESTAEITKKYRKYIPAAAVQATRTEQRAVSVERDAEDCYKAAYLADRIGTEFEGMITSVSGQGIYVELPNTVEGMIRADALGADLQYDGLFTLKSRDGKTYRVGDPLRVVCTRADVASGQIDFLPQERVTSNEKNLLHHHRKSGIIKKGKRR